MKTLNMRNIAIMIATLAAMAMPARAEPEKHGEIPGDAIQNYLSEDMKRVPDGVYIPYPEDVEKFKNSPLYQFLERLGPEQEVESGPSGEGCPVNKKFLENV